MRSKVVRVGETPIKDFLQSHDEVLLAVILHTGVPGSSPNCERFFPTFEKLARTLYSMGSKTICAEVNVTEQSVAHMFGWIVQFPLVALCRGPEALKRYSGALFHDDILAYLTRQAMPAVTAIGDALALDELRTVHSTCVVAFLGPGDEDVQLHFRAVAEKMRDGFAFGIVTGRGLAEAEGVHVPGIAVYKAVAERKTIVAGPWGDPKSMGESVRLAARPLVLKLLPELHNQYLEDTLPIGYFFTSSHAQEDAVASAMLPLARKYGGKVQFVTADVVELFPDLLDTMHMPSPGIGDEPWPSFALLDPLPNRKYPFGPVHIASDMAAVAVCGDPSALWQIDHHVAAFLGGKLKPVIKSKPIPQPDPSSAITEIVGLTYDTIVLDNTRDVFVEFCTTHCAGCFAAQPQYELLARLYAAHPDGPAVGGKVVIAKVDIEENDVPDRDLKGTPWFKLYPAANKDSPATYIGGWKWDAFADFIKENGTHGIGLDIPGYREGGRK